MNWFCRAVPFGLLLLVLGACEDEGNRGDDNLFTGWSLLIVLVIALIVFAFWRKGRNGR